MLCQECKKKPNCIKMCKELYKDLQGQEVSLKEMLWKPESINAHSKLLEEPEWHMRHPEYRKWIKRALAGLADDDKWLLWFKFATGMSLREMGRIYKVSHETIRTRLNRLLSKVKHKLTKPHNK